MSLNHNDVPPPKPAQENQDSEDDSEDDDFAPEAFKPRQKRSAHNDSSEEDDSDAEATDQPRTKADQGDNIDADEVAAMKREREQMIEEAGGEHRLGKRRRAAAVESDTTAAETRYGDSEIVANEAEEAWKEMQTLPDTSATEAKEVLSSTDMVSVPHTYKFAGEMHTSTKLLPRWHPEAISYLASISSPTSAPTTDKPIPRPGPRKKKSSLASLAAAASTTKPTKLNTLEKSKLDWESFKQTPSGGLTQQERDEIEQQTKGGASGLGNMKGYLERQDFLDRVRGRTGQADK